MMKQIGSEGVAYSFDARHEPVLRVAEGEVFRIKTPTDDPYGAIAARIEGKPVSPDLTEASRRAFVHAPPMANGVVGPIAIENCCPGDVLAISIHAVEPGPLGYVALMPGVGPRHDTRKYPDCDGPHVHVIEHLPGPSGTTRDGRARFSESATWDLQPFVGTLAVAPERETHSSLFGQGPWGGNIDCREFRAGHVILVKAQALGGLLYIGDAHGGQGDTEFAGIADETTATVELSCQILKGKTISGLRIIKPQSIVALGLGRPLEQAVEQASFNLIDWLRDEYGIGPRESFLRFSADPGFRVRTYQMVSSGPVRYVAGAEYPMDRLRGLCSGGRASGRAIRF
jgi:acetamidase/formamidase